MCSSSRLPQGLLWRFLIYVCPQIFICILPVPNAHHSTGPPHQPAPNPGHSQHLQEDAGQEILAMVVGCFSVPHPVMLPGRGPLGSLDALREQWALSGCFALHVLTFTSLALIHWLFIFFTFWLIYLYLNLFLCHFSDMRVFSSFRDDIQWGKRSRNKSQKYMSREELYSRASLEIVHLSKSQTLKMCGSRITYFYPISLMFKLCLQVTLLDRMLWLTLSLLRIAECDIKTCIINKTACDLGFQPVVAISEDGCCPIFSCSKYHVSLRCFIYSLSYFIFSKSESKS